jgi:hypothetical protein
LSIEDFKNGRQTSPIDWMHKDDKTKLKQFFLSPELIIIEHGNHIIYNKNSIIAIQLINGRNYRFINRIPCLIADTGFLYIYSCETRERDYKQSGPYRRIKEIPVAEYYFSSAVIDDVYKLTMENLSKYVIKDPKSADKISSRFKNDEELKLIDPSTGLFEINKIITSLNCP